ncbi:MAG: hypothetical protein FWG05_02770, partial [Kiritimatiellaeota bacterium]|nr:hypothetical protein [Kiritimatiellota bacterium]
MKKYFVHAIIVIIAAVRAVSAIAQDAYQMRVSFPGYDNREETLFNFPALVVFTNNVGGSGFDFGAMPFADPKGRDLRFFGDDGEPVPFEIDSWDTNGVCAVWVQVPELKPDGSSFVRAVWGGTFVSQGRSSYDVWDDFLLVQHYNENNSGAVADATAAKQTAAIRNPSYAYSEGKFGGSANLSADWRNNVITMNNGGIGLGSAWTISVWFKELMPRDYGDGNHWRTLTRGPVKNHHIIISQYGDDVGVYMDNGPSDPPAIDGGFYPVSPAQIASDYENGYWRQFYAVGTDNTTSVYVDGELIGFGANFQCDVPVYAIDNYQEGGQKFANYLDEFRIADCARSSNWVWAAYASESGDPAFAVYELSTAGDLPFALVYDAVQTAPTAADFSCRIFITDAAFPFSPDSVELHYALADGVYETPVAASEIAPNVYSASVPNLILGTNYVFKFKAEYDNGAIVIWSDAGAYETQGAAEFGAPSAAAFADAITFLAPLDPGAGLQWAQLWISENEADLANPSAPSATLACTWSSDFPSVLSHRVENLADDFTLYARFVAFNIMPDGTDKPVTVMSGIVSATTGSCEVFWDNDFGNGIWDTASANWHFGGDAPGTAQFAHGNTAIFPINAPATVSLADNTAVSDARLFIGNGASFALAGAGKTLTVFGTLSVNDSSYSAANAIDAPKISGPGSFGLCNGRFRLGNSANDYTGITLVGGGTLDAPLAGIGATPLGAGDISLGSYLPRRSAATLNITAAESPASMTAPALCLQGGMNAGILAVDGDAAVSFGELDYDDGATLQLALSNGATADVAEIPNGNYLPPFVVTASGDYVRKTASGLVAIDDYSAFPNIFTNTTLAANTAVVAARPDGSLDLGGNTLTLGGVILGN